MATRLEIAKNKLVRLEREYHTAINNVYEHQKLTNGQPMNDKRNGQSWFNKKEKIENKIFRLKDELDSQRERVSWLEMKEDCKKNGINARTGGLILSVDNVERVKQAIENKEYCSSTLRKYKQWLNEVEKAKTVEIPKKLQKLIDNGEVRQWQKRPNYYFISKFRKVAVVLEDGKLIIDYKYAPKTEEEKEYINNLIVI